MTSKPAQPKPKRPHMPDYGISKKPAGMMTWEWVEDQMATARNYWICSVTPDGKPHATPVWGVWLDGALYFSCSRKSRKARNLTVNPAIVIHLESGDNTVICEGVAQPVNDKTVLKHIAQIYGAKYPPFTPDLEVQGNVFFMVRPQAGFSWLESDFPKTATRWDLT
jgi:hypothetical protein